MKFNPVSILLLFLFQASNCDLGFAQTQSINSFVVKDANHLAFDYPSLINLNANTWAFLNKNDLSLTEESISLNILKATSFDLENDVIVLSGNNFIIKSASLIQEWSSEEKIAGIGCGVYPIDGTFQLFLFEIENGQISWTVIDSTESNYGIDVSKYFMINNYIHLIFAQQKLDSAQIYYSRHYYKISQLGELKFKSIIDDGDYISSIAKYKNDQIILSGMLQDFYITDTLNAPQTPFYEYEKANQQEPLAQLFFPEKIETRNNSIFIGAKANFTKDFTTDSDGIILKLNPLDFSYDYKAFEGIDIINGQVLNSRDDCRLNSFDFQSDSTLFQATTLNSYSSIWFEESTNSLLISYLDTNLNMIWQTTYWPEDSMRILCLQVKAQPDGGVVLINQVRNWKYEPENGYDLQFLRFNNKGQLMGQTLLPLQNNELSIYPNPSSGLFQFQTTEKIEAIEIFDLNGRMVFETNHQSQIDIRHLPNNAYLARIILENGNIETKRLVLMK